MDLNLIVYDGNCDDKTIISNKINYALKLGYKTIALSVEWNGNNIQNIPSPINIKTECSEIKILHRLTVKIDETIQLYQLTKHANLKYYDLLAIEPLNEKMLNYITSGNFECDIITFNFVDSKIVSSIKKTNFSLPISKGIGIEINYSNCLSSSSVRKQTMAYGQMLVDKTSAKNIILSSGARSETNTKSPRDVVYIGLLFSLNENQGKKAVYQNGTNVIKHSELRKSIVSSVIEVIELNDKNIFDELKRGNKRNIPKIEMESAKKVKS